MRTRPWVSLRLVTALAVTISAAVIGMASAQSASAATACGTQRALFGPWFAMQNSSHRNLAWTQASGQFAGALVSLKSYTGTKNQCWKFLGGFGGGRLEIEDTQGFCLSLDPPADSGGPFPAPIPARGVFRGESGCGRPAARLACGLSGVPGSGAGFGGCRGRG